MSKGVRACGLFLAVAIGCAQHPSASAPTPAIAGNVSYLINSVASSRATLDSAVQQLHRTSGDTSASAVARSRQFRRRVAVLDSAYRANLAELQWTINASSAGVMPSNARFPVDA